MGIIDTLLNMSREEIRVLLAIAASACALCGYVFFMLGKARGWADRHAEVDRNNVVVESAFLRELPGGRVELAIETADRMPTLHEVLCDARLERLARARVSSCEPGDPLFGTGDDHYIAMERVGLLITGADHIATQSAMMGRHDDYHIDTVAVLLTSARGEDGLKMARIIKTNPDDLARLLEEAYIARIVPLRQVHRDYIPVLRTMARHYAAALADFELNSDEREAGRHAAVWTTFVRSQRTLTANEVRRIVEAELAQNSRTKA